MKKIDKTTAADKTAMIMEKLAADFSVMIAAGIANPGEWRKSWKQLGAARPTNVVTKHAYTGGNWLVLAFESMLKGWGHEWSTYNGWASLGGQVRKGEKSTAILAPTPFVSKVEAARAAAEGREPKTSIIYRAVPIFNAAQVDGLPDELDSLPDASGLDTIKGWLLATGAEITHWKSHSPSYSSLDDVIRLPFAKQFDSASAYAATAAHEVAHWTGHKTRLDRSLGNPFGSEAYAREELIAELAAARISQQLGYEIEPSVDHGQYLASWLKVVTDDPKALWTAASGAAKAVAFLDKLTNVFEEVEAK